MSGSEGASLPEVMVPKAVQVPGSSTMLRANLVRIIVMRRAWSHGHFNDQSWSHSSSQRALHCVVAVTKSIDTAWSVINVESGGLLERTNALQSQHTGWSRSVQTSLICPASKHLKQHHDASVVPRAAKNGVIMWWRLHAMFKEVNPCLSP